MGKGTPKNIKNVCKYKNCYMKEDLMGFCRPHFEKMYWIGHFDDFLYRKGDTIYFPSPEVRKVHGKVERKS